MKLKEIDRKRYLSNTPILKWIKIIAYASTIGVGFYTVYYYNYKSQEFKNSVSKYTYKFSSDIRIKTEDKANKPLQRTAYTNYLKEKKAYEAQLSAETKIRLEKIKQASLESPTKSKEESYIEKTDLKNNLSKRSYLNYLTFGYWSSSN